MEIEVREVPLKDRDRYQTRLKSYSSELSKLDKDLVCISGIHIENVFKTVGV